MIINTVILFLSDLLPVFILFCYVYVLFERTGEIKLFWLQSILFGGFGSLIFAYYAQYISDWFDGAGIEVLRTLLLSFSYLCLVVGCFVSSTCKRFNAFIKPLLISGCSLLLVEKGSSFLIYFTVNMQLNNNLINIVIGCFVGIGICLSFSVLFSFILKELLYKKQYWATLLFWCLFLAGQVSASVNYLSQVDLLHVGPSIVNFGHYINDNSELGHILKALVGYEASPSITLIIIYVIAFILSFFLSVKFNHTVQNHNLNTLDKSRAI